MNLFCRTLHCLIPLIILFGGISGYAYAADKTQITPNNLEKPTPDLGSTEKTVQSILDTDPDNSSALEIQEKIKPKKKKPNKKQKTPSIPYLWETNDSVDSPYIETPNEEKTISDVLALDPVNKEALEQLRDVSKKKFSLASFFASLEGKRWGGGFRLGSYKPSLGDLNYGLFNGPISGSGSVFIDPNDTAAGQEPSAFAFEAPIPAFSASTEAGIEFRKEIDRKHSYIIGLGSWEAKSQSSIAKVALPIQNLSTPADLIRRAQFSFTYFYFGWKYNLFQFPKKLRFYTRLSINEYFDMDYREDHIYSFTGDSDISGFKRILITRTQATGALSFAGGLGAEYFFREWLSLGIEVNRIVSVTSFNLRHNIENTDFSNDANSNERGIFEELPYDFDARTNMLFRRNDGSVEVIKLRFDGWKYMLQMAFYY